MLRSSLLARSIAGALALSLVAAACASDDPAEETADTEATTEDTTEETTEETTEDTTESTEATEDGEAAEGETIVDVAAGNPDFSILVEAVEKAGLVDALSAEGELTVFAPTNAAFEAFLEENELTKEELLENPDLAGILTYHVLASKVDSAAALVAAEAGEPVVTLQGESLELSLDGESLKVGDATVIQPDVEASNGVIHAIDQVLPLPA